MSLQPLEVSLRHLPYELHSPVSERQAIATRVTATDWLQNLPQKTKPKNFLRGHAPDLPSDRRFVSCPPLPPLSLQILYEIRAAGRVKH